jgi:hypothetical protein
MSAISDILGTILTTKTRMVNPINAPLISILIKELLLPRNRYIGNNTPRLNGANMPIKYD